MPEYATSRWKKQFRVKESVIILTLVIICFWATLRILTGHYFKERHLISLAKAFLQGKIELTQPSDKSQYLADYALFKNYYYVYFGPLPSILLIPFVWIGKNSVPQTILTIILAPIALWQIFRLFRQFLGRNDTWWLWLTFIYGTSFFSTVLVNGTAYQVQAIALFFLIFALAEYCFGQRWWLIGLFLSMAVATRLNLILASSFFGLQIIWQKNNWLTKLKRLSQLILPIILTLMILGFYNQARFGNFWETGYRYNTTDKNDPRFSKARQYGLFSFKHLPGNLYTMFLKGPKALYYSEYYEEQTNPTDYLLTPPYLAADWYGMGIFFVSPLFFYLFGARLNRQVKILWLTIGIMLLPILFYYSAGFIQYGNRYSLDFLPFVFLILIERFKKRGIPTFAKIVIYGSILFNAFYGMSYLGDYPLIGRI